MLDLPNFGRMNKSTMSFESRFVGDIIEKNYDIIPFI